MLEGARGILLKTFEKETIDELIVHISKKEKELKGKNNNQKDLRALVDSEEKHEKVVEDIGELDRKEEDLKKNKKEHSHAEQLGVYVDFISEHTVRNKLCGALKTATMGYLTCFSARGYPLLDIDASHIIPTADIAALISGR